MKTTATILGRAGNPLPAAGGASVPASRLVRSLAPHDDVNAHTVACPVQARCLLSLVALLLLLAPGISLAVLSPPLPPTGVQAVGGAGQVTLTWQASATATSYNVKRSLSSGAEQTIASSTTTNYTDSNVNSGTTYYYKVSGINSSGEGSNSVEVSATTATTSTNLNLVVNGGFETGNFTNWTLGGAASITNHGHVTYATIVDNGSTWEISPHAGNDAAYLATFGALGYLSQTLSTAPGQVYSLTISFWVNNYWGDPNMFVATFNGTNLFGATNLVANGWINIQTNITIIGPPSGSSVLQFMFEDDEDALGLDDVSVSFALAGPPPAPTNLVAVAGYEQVALSWAPSAGATLYLVKRSTNSGGETTICALYATNYTDTGLADGTKYYYEVTAVNLYVGGTSSEVSATTAPTRAMGGVAYADSADFTLNTLVPAPPMAGVAYADSLDFTLNTLVPSPPMGGVAYADSADFTLNTLLPAPPMAGVAWADSSDFTLNTLNTVANMISLGFSVSGNLLTLSWPGGMGWRLLCQTNNLAVGLGNYWFTVPGSGSMTNTTVTINPANPAVFYRLVYP